MSVCLDACRKRFQFYYRYTCSLLQYLCVFTTFCSKYRAGHGQRGQLRSESMDRKAAGEKRRRVEGAGVAAQSACSSRYVSCSFRVTYSLVLTGMRISEFNAVVRFAIAPLFRWPSELYPRKRLTLEKLDESQKTLNEVYPLRSIARGYARLSCSWRHKLTSVYTRLRQSRASRHSGSFSSTDPPHNSGAEEIRAYAV